MSKEILVVCAAGMTSSMIAARMQKAAEADHYDVVIHSADSGDAENTLKEKQPDVVLLAPQVRYFEEAFDKLAAGTKTKIGVMDMRAFGLMDGEKILTQARTLLGDA